jgi:hypothetical protein
MSWEEEKSKGEWRKIEKEVNQELEDEYKRKKNNGSLIISIGNNKYLFTFDDMIQQNLETKEKKQIRRINESEEEYVIDEEDNIYIVEEEYSKNTNTTLFSSLNREKYEEEEYKDEKEIKYVNEEPIYEVKKKNIFSLIFSKPTEHIDLNKFQIYFKNLDKKRKEIIYNNL